MQISYIWCSTDFGLILQYSWSGLSWYVEIPMLPLLGIEESRRFIFLNLRESGAVGKRGQLLLRTWETQSVGRRACGGAASPAFQICDMWLSLALIKLRTFVSTCLIVSAGCETQSIGKYVRVLWSYKTRSLLILGKFKLKRGEMLPTILVPDSDM